MQSVFSKKFNGLTGDKFEYIKLTRVDFFIKTQTVKMSLIYPMEKREEVEKSKAEIESAIKKVIATPANLEIDMKAACFDLEYCKQVLGEFFKSYPSVAPFIDSSGISFESDGQKVKLNLPLESDACSYCRERKIKEEVESFLDAYFTEKIDVNFAETQHKSDGNGFSTYSDDCPKYYMSMEGGRTIIPQNVTEFIGKKIDEPAMYIEDCNGSLTESVVVLCGTVNDFKELQKADGSKTFYKFNLVDYTGSMTCLVFTNKSVLPEKAKELHDGDAVVVRGQLNEREFRGEKSLSVFVRAISKCTLPENFVKNEILREVPEHYTTIFPEPYIQETQSNLFDVDTKEEVLPYLVGKTFVVYDFETTGTDTRICNITEIGAVKLVNGKFTETFSTLVNPGEKLSERVSELTHITDEMLEDQPTIDKVLPDFNKFCDGAILVGQNSNDFDYKILCRLASEQKLKFPDEHEDTLVIARKYLRTVHNYKLGTLAKYYDVVNENAHRALDDAITTAKVFMNLAKFL
ncbi:MAG: exonuclease domain-containing protein [Firmicutes bacterium]|nr:exonuclease domain-containing protein [Bacillota bacterium]MDY5531129.1 exonuclease domain-containing protein [Pumilibacteraceae bacterium]